MILLRALILISLASFVLSALTSCLCVKMASDVAGGVGIQSGDPTTLGIGSLGAVAVLGISGRALWRERRSVGWALFGGVIAVLSIVGAIGGGIWGARISADHVAYVRTAAADTCRAFVAVHPGLGADCEARAITCRAVVHEHPPVVERGLGPPPTPGSGEPTRPEERAIWDCLAR